MANKGYSSATAVLFLIIPFALTACDLPGASSGPGPRSVHPSTLQYTQCSSPSQVTSSPQSIEDVVNLINELPMPVSIGCFLEALSPPLNVFSSNSELSAQPAVGNQNPRIFIFGGRNLLMTVVPDGGTPASTLELGEATTSTTTSVKAAIQFPVLAPLTSASPYDTVRVQNGNGTKCQSCHSGESAYFPINFAQAFISAAMKPPAASEVSLDYMKSEASICNWSQNPDRCRMLNAVFIKGQAVRHAFPSGSIY